MASRDSAPGAVGRRSVELPEDEPKGPRGRGRPESIFRRLITSISPAIFALRAARGQRCTMSLPASGPFGWIRASSHVGTPQSLHSRAAPAAPCCPRDRAYLK